MTVTRNQRNLSETSETLPPSTTLLKQAQLLKTSQAIFSKDLAPEEIQFWKNFLQPFGLPEIEYAFENWNRNGRYFPKPAEIKELIESYRESKRPAYRLQAPPMPGGFGKVEILALWGLVNKRVEEFKKSGQPYIPLTDDEITELCQQVAAKRDAA